MIEHKDNALFRLVLSQLVSCGQAPEPTAPRKKYVMVDNYRIHFAKSVQEWLTKHANDVQLLSALANNELSDIMEMTWAVTTGPHHAHESIPGLLLLVVGHVRGGHSGQHFPC